MKHAAYYFFLDAHQDPSLLEMDAIRLKYSRLLLNLSLVDSRLTVLLNPPCLDGRTMFSFVIELEFGWLLIDYAIDPFPRWTHLRRMGRKLLL